MVDIDEKNQEITGMMVDRLLTVGMRWGGRGDRDIIPRLYDCACQKYGGKPVSLVAAQRMIDKIKDGDNVFLVTGCANLARLPKGETDGPPGVASLARAIRMGLKAVPIIVTGCNDMDPVCKTVEAAEVLVLDYEQAKATSAITGTSITFPTYGREGKEESKKFAAKIIDEYSPKAAISVECQGPNKKGVKHFGSGYDFEANDKAAGEEYIFTEASARGILTIGVIDQGNEIGSGTIEEDVRRITPWGDTCRCPCEAGLASVTKTDVVFPAAVSNWGAYGITAMVAYLLGNPEILQDTYTERRMLEACIRAGVVDGNYGRPCMSVDTIDYLTGEAMLTMLHGIIRSALKGAKVDRFGKK
jgi:hypothetical protein